MSVCVCQKCGHLRELHNVEERGERAVTLRLRTNCASRGCGCRCYSGEIWRRGTDGVEPGQDLIEL